MDSHGKVELLAHILADAVIADIICRWFIYDEFYDATFPTKFIVSLSCLMMIIAAPDY